MIHRVVRVPQSAQGTMIGGGGRERPARRRSQLAVVLPVFKLFSEARPTITATSERRVLGST